MKYQGKWEGSEEPDITSGVAIFEVEGNTYFFRLENFIQFLQMGKMIQAAYLGGSEDAAARMQEFLDKR